MAEVYVHRLRYAYSDKGTVPNVDTDDQQRLAELLEGGWRIVSHSVVSLGSVESASAFPQDTVAYEAHMLLENPTKG